MFPGQFRSPRISLREGEDRVNRGIGVLGQTPVIDVGQAVAELVVADIKRNTGLAARTAEPGPASS